MRYRESCHGILMSSCVASTSRSIVVVARGSERREEGCKSRWGSDESVLMDAARCELWEGRGGAERTHIWGLRESKRCCSRSGNGFCAYSWAVCFGRPHGFNLSGVRFVGDEKDTQELTGRSSPSCEPHRLGSTQLYASGSTSPLRTSLSPSHSYPLSLSTLNDPASLTLPNLE